MRRTTIWVGLALLALSAATITSTALAKGPPAAAAKTWICHRTHSATKPYVKISVSAKALKGHAKHDPADIIPAPAAGCPTTALTPTRGGTPLPTNLTSTTTGLSGQLSIRLRPGQGQLCFVLDVSASSALTVSAASITKGTTTINLAPLPSGSGTSLESKGCITLTRAVVLSMLHDSTSFTVSVTTSAGVLTGTVSA